MRRLPPNTYDRPWLLLCEGYSDKRFFDRLIESNPDIGPSFQVEYVDGQGGFSIRLRTARDTSESFQENVKAVLIVVDKEDDEDGSFNLVRNGLLEIGFPAPAKPSEVAKKKGYPDILILMIPIRGNAGNIETLCLESILDQWSLKTAISSYVVATPANRWGVAKQSKMKMQCVLSAICEERPDTSFGNHWDLNGRYHLKIDHSSFEELVRFLKNFGSLIS